MFERYSEKSRRVIFFARYEASNFGSQRIETHHLLLGLLRENLDVFAPFLKSPDEASAIRQEIEQRFPRQAPVPTSADLPLAHESKRVLAYAAEEAERLRHQTIEPLHLLLGLLREQGSAVGEILRQRGLGVEALRTAAAGPSLDPAEAETEQAALQAAVLALPADRQDAAWRVLEALGKEKVRVEVSYPGRTFWISFGGEAGDESGTPAP